MRPIARLHPVLVAAGLLGSAVALAPAQSEPVSFGPAREKAARAFAREHHPELAEILGRLKQADRGAYERAVREVSQASERLARLQESDPERYELSLRIWTLDSRIRLLAARSTMSDEPGIDDRLRDLLRERQQVRLAMLRLDRERLRTRLERLETQIGQIERDPAGAVENDLARIKREVRASANRERRAARGDSDDGNAKRSSRGERKDAGERKAEASEKSPRRKPPDQSG